MKIFLLIALFFCKIATLHAEPLSWLRAEGGKIVNAEGQTVILRGVNIGGWLAEETWLLPFEEEPPKNSPYTPIQDYVSLWRNVEIRFGAAEMDRIRTAFRTAFITDGDFARIRQAGLNCVRLPFLYDLMNEPKGLFFWLDRAIQSAERHGLYVILDMHGTPGRQSTRQHTGEGKSGLLFFERPMVEKTIEIWTKIAERYKNSPIVAGYDLINEPMGAPNSSTLYLVQDQIYRAIRQIDTKHIIVIEDGFKGLDNIPHIDVVGWKNIMLSTHLYAYKGTSQDDFPQHMQRFMNTAITQQAVHKVPIYLGEFNVEPHGTAEMIKSCITALQAKEMSWSLWTYKLAGKKAAHSLWGIYSPKKKLKRINLFQDDKKKIFEKLEQLRTENFEPHKALMGVLKP